MLFIIVDNCFLGIITLYQDIIRDTARRPCWPCQGVDPENHSVTRMPAGLIVPHVYFSRLGQPGEARRAAGCSGGWWRWWLMALMAYNPAMNKIRMMNFWLMVELNGFSWSEIVQDGRKSWFMMVGCGFPGVKSCLISGYMRVRMLWSTCLAPATSVVSMKKDHQNLYFGWGAFWAAMKHMLVEYEKCLSLMWS